MPLIEFPYYEFPIPPSDPFPTGTAAWRPVAIADIRRPGAPAGFRCAVVLDSGADHCVFPASFAAVLGIDLLQLRKNLTGGVGTSANTTYYTDLFIDLGSGIEFKSYVAFTAGMDLHGLGLLGQAGFFEYYNVAFFHKLRKFTIETT